MQTAQYQDVKTNEAKATLPSPPQFSAPHCNEVTHLHHRNMMFLITKADCIFIHLEKKKRQIKIHCIEKTI